MICLMCQRFGVSMLFLTLTSSIDGKLLFRHALETCIVFSRNSADSSKLGGASLAASRAAQKATSAAEQTSKSVLLQAVAMWPYGSVPYPMQQEHMS